MWAEAKHGILRHLVVPGVPFAHCDYRIELDLETMQAVIPQDKTQCGRCRLIYKYENRTVPVAELKKLHDELKSGPVIEMPD